MGYARF
jgi:hypothetical protein